MASQHLFDAAETAVENVQRDYIGSAAAIAAAAAAAAAAASVDDDIVASFIAFITEGKNADAKRKQKEAKRKLNSHLLERRLRLNGNEKLLKVGSSK